MVERDTFVSVIAQAGQDEQRLLADRQNALLLRRHRDTGRRMGVQHAHHVVTHFMHGAVDGVSRRIDLVGAVHQLVAGLIDLDQARCSDLVKHQPVRVD